MKALLFKSTTLFRPGNNKTNLIENISCAINVLEELQGLNGFERTNGIGMLFVNNSSS